MNIGQAASASGVTAKMIRYYEETGLIPPATRAAQGYRIYNDKDVHRLRFIRSARTLGFSIPEISALLGLWNDQHRQSSQVKELAQAHLDDLQARIDGLKLMARTLQDLISSCAGDHRADCPILDRLAREDASGHTDGSPGRGER